MNKVIKLSVMAGACILFALVSVSSVYADELILSDGFDSYVEPDNNLISSDILITNDGYFGNDTLTISEPMVINDLTLHDFTDYSTPTGLYGINDLVINDGINELSGSGSYGINELREIRGTAPGSLNDGQRIYGDVMDVLPLVTPEPAPEKLTKKDRLTEKASRPSKPVRTEKPAKTPTVTNSSASDIEMCLEEVNARRAAAGVGRLNLNSSLNRAAQARAAEITEKFSHIRPNGRTNVSILGEYGIDYDMAGENIACSSSSPSEVVEAWSQSQTHNRCMLRSGYTQAGVGTVTVSGCTYWVLILTD